MVSKSIANVLVGVAFAFKILRDDYVDTENWLHYVKVCHAVKGLVVFSLAASVYNFVALAVERWLMLSWQMQRWEEVEESSLLSRKLVVAIVWGLSLFQVHRGLRYIDSRADLLPGNSGLDMGQSEQQHNKGVLLPADG